MKAKVINTKKREVDFNGEKVTFVDVDFLVHMKGSFGADYLLKQCEENGIKSLQDLSVDVKLITTDTDKGRFTNVKYINFLDDEGKKIYSPKQEGQQVDKNGLPF